MYLGSGANFGYIKASFTISSAEMIYSHLYTNPATAYVNRLLLFCCPHPRSSATASRVRRATSAQSCAVSSDFSTIHEPPQATTFSMAR